MLPDTPAPGLVEFDAARAGRSVLTVARAALAEGGPVGGRRDCQPAGVEHRVERATGQPLAPGIGWQDLRTVGTCLALQGEGIRLAPNASATKVMAILDEVDPERARAERGELCFGTVDSWVAWTLSGGASAGAEALHVTDATNVAVTALVDPATIDWDHGLLERLRIPLAMMPAVVDSSGELGTGRGSARVTSHLRRRRGPAGVAGRPGLHAAGNGQGDLRHRRNARPVHRPRPRPRSRPDRTQRRRHLPHRGLPVGGTATWGTEAVMLSAGTAIEWLRDDLGLLVSSEESAAVAARCESSGDVWFVPALLGLGTPVWDFGARGTLVGLTRGSGRPEVVRAVLEGVAHRGADLVEASERDSGYAIDALRVDGGMSANEVFVSALADAIGRPVEVSPVLEATTLGAGLLAGLAIGVYASSEELAQTFTPRRTVEPRNDELARSGTRERWLAARAKAEATIPELSGITF